MSTSVSAQQGKCDKPASKGVNLKSGPISFISFALEAGLRSWPLSWGSFSKVGFPGYSSALAIDSATCLILISSFSLTIRGVQTRMTVRIVNCTGEDDGFDALVFAELPDEEFREIARIDELTEG